MGKLTKDVGFMGWVMFIYGSRLLRSISGLSQRSYYSKRERCPLRPRQQTAGFLPNRALRQAPSRRNCHETRWEGIIHTGGIFNGGGMTMQCFICAQLWAHPIMPTRTRSFPHPSASNTPPGIRPSLLVCSQGFNKIHRRMSHSGLEGGLCS